MVRFNPRTEPLQKFLRRGGLISSVCAQFQDVMSSSLANLTTVTHSPRSKIVRSVHHLDRNLPRLKFARTGALHELSVRYITVFVCCHIRSPSAAALSALRTILAQAACRHSRPCCHIRSPSRRAEDCYLSIPGSVCNDVRPWALQQTQRGRACVRAPQPGSRMPIKQMRERPGIDSVSSTPVPVATFDLLFEARRIAICLFQAVFVMM